MGERRYWLLKTEPSSFSFDDLWSSPRRRTAWDGVRNHQARNFLRDTMQPSDLVIVYHSSAEPPGVAGFGRIASRARPDPTQFDPTDEHFDPKAGRASPTWFEIDVEAIAKGRRFVPLAELRSEPSLARMLVLQRGQRLSVQPVQEGEWRAVVAMAGLDPDEIARSGGTPALRGGAAGNSSRKPLSTKEIGPANRADRRPRTRPNAGRVSPGSAQGA
jgi:predicted RNA-binding protein with PUA-like domain